MDADGSAIACMLDRCRQALDRVEPADLEAVATAGALVIDMRPVQQRLRDGELPGALVVDRNVLEWRLDPTSPHRLAVADDPARRIVLAGGFTAWSAYVAEVQADAIATERRVAAH